MAKRPKRALNARLVVGLASMAFPLIVTGAAQAAIAGATHASMTNRPVLQSATIQGGANQDTIVACFDKTISSNLGTGGTTGFQLGGYRAGNTTTNLNAVIDRSATNCVDLTGNPDPSDYTVLKVGAASVTANNNTAANGNIADAVGLTGSTSHDGTQGITTGPELVGILTPTGPTLSGNALTFVFDKDLGAVVAGTNFTYYNSSGQPCNARGAMITSATTVTASFAQPGSTGTGCTGTVSAAVRGFVLNGAVNNASDLNSTNPDTSAVLPNSTAPSVPNLTGAALGSGGQSVTYTFDKPVSVVDPTAFDVALANGNEVPGSTASPNGNTVTVQYPTLGAQYEFAVSASVETGAVSVVNNPAATNTSGAAPIGGNAGASAIAFTTGPDVFGVTISKGANTVTVNLDDRVTTNTGSPTLYDAAGTPVAAATPTSTTPGSSNPGPGPESITYTYPPSSITNATSAGFAQGMYTQNGPNPTQSTADTKNIDQLDGTISTAAILRAVHSTRHHAVKHHAKKHHAKKHAKKHTKKH